MGEKEIKDERSAHVEELWAMFSCEQKYGFFMKTHKNRFIYQRIQLKSNIPVVATENNYSPHFHFSKWKNFFYANALPHLAV